MVFPTKHIKISESLFGLGSFVLSIIKNESKAITIDNIWNEYAKLSTKSDFKLNPNIDQLILVIDYLYLIGAIDSNINGEIYICN